MIDQEVDIFLEHFGAKGMKWGVRKTKATFGSKNPNQKRNIKRAAVGVGAVVAVGVGAVFARKFVKSNGHQTMKAMNQSMNRSVAPSKARVNDLLKSQGKVNAASLAKRHAKQLKGAEQHLMIGDQARRGISNFPTVGAQPWQRG